MLSIAAGLVLGLLVGSFLNVVIYRVPVMLEREWAQQCAELAAAGRSEPADAPDAPPRFNLLTPASTCPGCKTRIAPWHNIPVLSWLLLRGRCANCAAPIPARYPLVELFTGVLSALALWHFGLTVAGAAALFFLWMLIALTFIDLDHQLLPDNMTYPLLWAGLALATLEPDAIPVPDLASAVLGAIAGYLCLWSVYWAFRLATGKEGMGYGDFKLLAAIGAWTGIQQLPTVILLSAVAGAAIGITLVFALGRDRHVPIPFGPYLAMAGIVTYVWGEQLQSAWLSAVAL